MNLIRLLIISIALTTCCSIAYTQGFSQSIADNLWQDKPIKMRYLKLFKCNKRDFNRFIRDYKELLVFWEENKDRSKIDEINSLAFHKNTYFECSYVLYDLEPSGIKDIDIRFEGNDQIKKTYSWITKYKDSNYGILHYIYHYVIITNSPPKSKLIVTFPNGKVKSLKP